MRDARRSSESCEALKCEACSVVLAVLGNRGLFPLVTVASR